MNERIEKLAREAGFKHPDHVGQCEIYAYFDHEKFAELIVSKCIALMDVNYRGDMYTVDVYACEYNNCINEQVETLEDYFGVNK